MPWLRAVSSRIAYGVATATWRAYAKAPGGRAERDFALAFGNRGFRSERFKALRADGSLRELPDHPLLQLLARPNPRMTGVALLKVTQVWLDLKGEAFWLIARNAAGMPDAVYPLPPHCVLDTPKAGHPFYRVSAGPSQWDVPDADMVYLRDPDAENPYGRGSGYAEALGDELEISEFASKYLRDYFYNNAMPPALISFKGAGKPALNEAKERWMQEHRGQGRAHVPHFTGAEIDVQRLDSTFADQEMSALRSWQHNLVREVFGVPPEIMGVIENSNRATIDAAQFLFAHNVLVPRLEFLRTELQAALVPQFDERLVLDYDSPVPEAREFQLQCVTSVPEAFQLNEVRGIAGMEPLAELEGKYARHASGAESPAQDAEGDAPEAEAEEPRSVGFRTGDPPWVADLNPQARAKKQR